MAFLIMHVANIILVLTVFKYELLDSGLNTLGDKFENLIYKIKLDLMHVIMLQLKATFVIGFSSFLTYTIFVSILNLTTIGTILYLIVQYYVIKNYVSNKKRSGH